MRRVSTLLLAATVAVAVSRPARASTVVASTVEDLARGAGAVVEGQVTATRSVPVDRGRRIVTLVTLQVSKAFKGGPLTTITVLVPGGVLGKIAQQVSGCPALRDGERVILFLERAPGLPHPVPRFRLTALGLSVYELHGKVAVRRTRGLDVVTGPLDRTPKQVHSDDRLDLATLRARIQAALRGPSR